MLLRSTGRLFRGNAAVLFSDLPEADFPHKTLLHDGRLAYILPLTFARARINVTSLANCWVVDEFF